MWIRKKPINAFPCQNFVARDMARWDWLKGCYISENSLNSELFAIVAQTNTSAGWQGNLTYPALRVICHWTWQWMVEARGVEPLSESPSTGTSPSADGYLLSLTQAWADTLTALGRVMMRGTVNSFRTHGHHSGHAQTRLVVLPGRTAALSSGENSLVVVL